MSWWIELVNENGEIVAVPTFSEGGTYAVGGSTEAQLNVTWNYNSFYYSTINAEQGIRYLDGKKAKEVIGLLEETVAKLGTERDSNYWKSTSGNAGYAISILLGWAKANPETTFKVN